MCGAIDDKLFYKPQKTDWRGYVDPSAKEFSSGSISNPDYFSTELQRRVKYEFAKRIDYSFLQTNKDEIGYSKSYRH